MRVLLGDWLRWGDDVEPDAVDLAAAGEAREWLTGTDGAIGALRLEVKAAVAFWTDEELANIDRIASRVAALAVDDGIVAAPAVAERFVVACLRVGAARRTSGVGQGPSLKLTSRTDVKEFAGLSNRDLQQVEAGFGNIRNGAVLMERLLRVMRDLELVTQVLGVYVGTSHVKVSRDSDEPGVYAASGGNGEGTVQHMLRSAAYDVLLCQNGAPALLRTVTAPSLTRRDVDRLHDPSFPGVRRRVEAYGLRDGVMLAGDGNPSAAVGLMLAARESKRARFSAGEPDPPVLLSAMRAPAALPSSSKPPSLHGVARRPPNGADPARGDGAAEAPLKNFVRQMPGNSAADVRAAVALLPDSLWLLEVGVELTAGGDVSETVEWGYAVNEHMVSGASLMHHSRETNWAQVYRGANGAVDQHNLPVSLTPEEEPAFYLLRIRAARDAATGTRPAIYVLCPLSLLGDEAATSRVVALMDAVHMREEAAAAVRAARSGALSVGARTITVHGRAGGQEIAWETARLLASAGRLVRRAMA